MSGLPRAPSIRKYSWWWDSHITPKNSKWLQENLTDMDSKIKAIIKLIEEDADSFARRAEMYYKKRPELMKFVEEFYRAYRALAERYDNATGVIRQAQRTMVEVFPNQDPLGIADDSLSSDHLQKGLSILNGGDTKQFTEDKVRKGLDFYEDLSVSEVVGIFENEIQVLKDALSQLEVEKEAGIVQYEDSLEKLSKLEEVSRELLDRANRAEEGFQVLKDSLTKLEAENKATLLEYQNCLVISANLEKNLFQAKDEAYKATCEKDEALDQYEQSLVKVLNLEINLKLAEENARDLMERADISEREIEDLKKALAKLTTEKESNILQYNKCLEEISNLKNQISSAKELSVSLEKSNEALNLELGSLVLKMSSQGEELTEKEKKLGEIWSCLEEERLRFIEAETNLQKLQNLHSETQDQLRFLALELEKKSNEMLRINEENKSLNKCILSSSMAIKEMKNDISDIVESKKKLADEVEIAMDQRIQLQTEKSDLNEILEQEKAEKLLILKKLETMEQIIGKNALSKSLLDLTDELEVARGKIRALEQSFEALLEEKTAILAEKAAIISQLKAKIEKLEKISEKNKTLKDSYELLEKAEFYLTDKKDTLLSQGNTTQQALEALGKRPGKLEAKCSGSETELESNFLKLEEICFLSDAEKKESSTFAPRTKTELAGMGGQICHLQEEVFSRKREFEDELDKTVNYQFEIFILRRCIEDLKENNSSLLMEVKYLSDKTQIIDMEKETLIKELKIKNELWIWSQNEANKLVELNGDLEKKLDKLTSLNAKINREIEEFNVIINNREYQIYKLSGENRELEVEIKKLKEEHGVITQLSDGEIYELKDRVIKKDAKIDLMEKKNGFLERENGRLKAQLASYGPLVMSLKDSVSSLENRTSCTKGQKRQNDGEKEVVSVNCNNGSADSKSLDINSELKDLQHKLKVIERTFIQKEKHEAKENHDTNTNLEIANKTIDSLKIKTCTNKEYSVPIYNKSDFENESTMKDIMLDKNSESSSYELSRRLERKFRSKRVESWDSTDLDHNIDFTIGKGKRVKSQKSKFESSDIEVEKELGVDTLEISRTFSQRSQEATKTKILERLNSDAQKLSDLQINIQDLLDKVENIEKRKKGKSIYKGDDSLREHLEEAEEAIIKLFDYNGKLMRNVEKRSFSSNVKLGVDSEECASARRRKIAEQARKTSEKIGKWQTEVQKIKKLMLKTDEKNEKETKGKSRVTEIRKRVMLRDYLYGSLRSPSHEFRKKSSSFCVCVQPSTRGD